MTYQVRLLTIGLVLSVGLNIILLAQYQNKSKLFERPETSRHDVSNNQAAKPKAQVSTYQPQNDQQSIALWLNAAREAFKYKAYKEALESYFQLGKLSQDHQAQLKAQWILQLKTLLSAEKANDEDLRDAGHFIALFLEQVAYDVDMQLLQADYLVAINRHQEAIIQTYELLKGITDTKLQQAINSKIHLWADAKIDQLSEALAWEPLIAFIKTIAWYEPDAIDYQLALAYAQYQLKRYEKAKAILVRVPDDPYYNQQVAILLEEVNRAAMARQAVAMQKVGEHYLVQGELNGEHSIQLLMDTGASLSVMSKKKFDQLKSQLNAEFINRVPINTAGGLIQAPIYQVKRFQIQNYKVDNIEFAVIDMDSGHSGDGLLGMNFLNRFRFQIDQEDSLLYLSPR